MEKIVIPIVKPRNPFVVLAKFKRAGAHKSKHDRLERALKKETKYFK